MKLPDVIDNFKIIVIILLFLIIAIWTLPDYRITERAPVKTQLNITDAANAEAPNINQTAALKIRAARTPAQTPNTTATPENPTPTPTITHTPITKATRAAPTPSEKTNEGYSITAWLVKNSSASDVLISLSYPAPSLSLTCSGYQNSSKPTLISNKGDSLFKIDNTHCSETEIAYTEYIIPSGTKEKTPLLLNYTNPFEFVFLYK